MPDFPRRTVSSARVPERRAGGGQAKTLDIVSATFLRTDASQSLTKTETPSVCARLPMGCAVGYPFNSTRTTLDSKMFAASSSSSPATLGVAKAALATSAIMGPVTCRSSGNLDNARIVFERVHGTRIIA